MSWNPQGWNPGGWDPEGWNPGGEATPPGPGFPAGGRFSVQLPSGRISVTLIQPGDDHVTTLVVEGRDIQIDRKAGSAFQFIPAFIDTNGNEYQPSTVHTKVVMRETGAQIVAMTEVESWEMGDPIIAPGSWTALVSPNVIREEHVIRVIGDNGNDAARNELALIVGCLNPER